jgi:DNA-binding transcriptional LysR family regulator
MQIAPAIYRLIRSFMNSQTPRTTLDQWDALCALADRGSFEAAAAAQNRSQSSLSYALKRLQEQLPVAVLVPQGRRALFTPQGEFMLQRARALLEEARSSRLPRRPPGAGGVYRRGQARSPFPFGYVCVSC